MDGQVISSAKLNQSQMAQRCHEPLPSLNAFSPRARRMSGGNPA
jgi:hypothetical protein